MDNIINNNLADVEFKPAFNLSEEQEKDFNLVMREEIDNIKYKILEQILREKDIEHDPEIKDYNTLKKSLKGKVSKTTLTEINREEEQAIQEMNEFVKNLESGGPLTIQKVLSTFNEDVLRPSAKFAVTYLISRALFDTMLFLPFNVRTIVGVASLGPVVYKAKKFFSHKKDKKISKQYDKLIEELKTVRDPNGEVLNNQFSGQDFEIIKEFLLEKGIKQQQLSYDDMVAHIYKLDNKDKMNLIKKINNSRENKINVNHELSKIRRKEIIDKVKNASESIILGTGIGMLVANFDKEITDLLDFSLSMRETHSIYENRTRFGENLTNTDLIPGGVLGATEFVFIKNIIESIIKSIYSKKKLAKNVKNNTPMSKNENIVFEILKNRELYKHPENLDRLNNMNSLAELKQYIKELPIKERKQVTNLLEKIHNKIKVSDKTKNMKELGKMLGNSVVLAANSMLVYQIILMLKYKLPQLFLPAIAKANNGTNTQDVLDAETVSVFETELESQASHVLKPAVSVQAVSALEPKLSPNLALESVASPIVETAEVIEEVASPIVETAEVIEEVASPIVETAEVIEEVASPVVENVEVIEEVISPVLENIEESATIPSEAEKVMPRASRRTKNSKISIEDSNTVDATKIVKGVGTAAVAATAAYWVVKGVKIVVAACVAPPLVPAAILVP